MQEYQAQSEVQSYDLNVVTHPTDNMQVTEMRTSQSGAP